MAPTPEQIVVDRAIHDLRNMVCTVLGTLELLRAMDWPGSEKPIDRAMCSLDRFERVMRDLSLSGSTPPPRQTSIDANQQNIISSNL